MIEDTIRAVKEAEKKAGELIADAGKQAAKITSDANAQAAEILKSAEAAAKEAAAAQMDRARADGEKRLAEAAGEAAQAAEALKKDAAARKDSAVSGCCASLVVVVQRRCAPCPPTKYEPKSVSEQVPCLIFTHISWVLNSYK